MIRETNIHTSGPTTDCPLPCFEEKFEIRTSSESLFPLEPQLGIFKELFLHHKGFLPTDDYIRSNIGRLVIGFDDFRVDTFEEKPRYTIQKVLSDFGGLIGIYLGASFISMAELMAALMGLIVTAIKKVRRGKTRALRRTEMGKDNTEL